MAQRRSAPKQVFLPLPLPLPLPLTLALTEP